VVPGTDSRSLIKRFPDVFPDVFWLSRLQVFLLSKLVKLVGFVECRHYTSREVGKGDKIKEEVFLHFHVGQGT
jgi:hypothetical protein